MDSGRGALDAETQQGGAGKADGALSSAQCSSGAMFFNRLSLGFSPSSTGKRATEGLGPRLRRGEGKAASGVLIKSVIYFHPLGSFWSAGRMGSGGKPWRQEKQVKRLICRDPRPSLQPLWWT